MRESEIEKYFVKHCTARGAFVRKVCWIGRVGAPDRVVIHAGQTFWVELKASGEKPRASQIAEHRAMRDAGVCVMVVDSLQAADHALKTIFL